MPAAVKRCARNGGVAGFFPSYSDLFPDPSNWAPPFPLRPHTSHVSYGCRGGEGEGFGFPPGPKETKARNEREAQKRVSRTLPLFKLSTDILAQRVFGIHLSMSRPDLTGMIPFSSPSIYSGAQKLSGIFHGALKGGGGEAVKKEENGEKERTKGAKTKETLSKSRNFGSGSLLVLLFLAENGCACSNLGAFLGIVPFLILLFILIVRPLRDIPL